MKKWVFSALDTWFFRDPSPFQQGEMGARVPESLFPPPISTLQGAIRTALAQLRGWRGARGADKGTDWPAELGDADRLGVLQLYGPYLQIEGRLVFPAPAILFGKRERRGDSGDWHWTLTRLVPGDAVPCDLNPDGVCLPVLPEAVRGGEVVEAFLTREGMEAVLSGAQPLDSALVACHLRLPEELWAGEYRVGIGLERRTRRASDGLLYTVRHVRPRPKVDVVVFVDGIPEDWTVPERLAVPLGGEGRAAAVEVRPCPGGVAADLPRMPELVEDGDHVYFTVTLLTAGWYEEKDADGSGTKRAVKQGPPDVVERVPGATCVTACVGKLVPVGGWDLRRPGPRPVVPLVPAGSTWFFRAPRSSAAAVADLHGRPSGPEPRQAYGYGQMVVGTWMPATAE